MGRGKKGAVTLHETLHQPSPLQKSFPPIVRRALLAAVAMDVASAEGAALSAMATEVLRTAYAAHRICVRPRQGRQHPRQGASILRIAIALIRSTTTANTTTSNGTTTATITITTIMMASTSSPTSISAAITTAPASV